MASYPADRDDDGPVTLHWIMQTMIGEGLKKHYEPPQKLSHELFVLLLQLKEQERRRTRTDKAAATVPSTAA
jgi:hypothetical protein